MTLCPYAAFSSASVFIVSYNESVILKCLIEIKTEEEKYQVHKSRFWPHDRKEIMHPPQSGEGV